MTQVNGPALQQYRLSRFSLSPWTPRKSADGEQEGFLNEELYPEIAGCSGLGMFRDHGPRPRAHLRTSRRR